MNEQNADGDTVLKLFAMQGQMEAVKFLAESGANIDVVDNNGWSALMNASENGDLEMVKFLVESGADVNKTNIYGWSALMSASENQHLEVVKFLVVNGTNIDAVDIDGKSAFDLSDNEAIRQFLDIAKKFAESGRTGDLETANKLLLNNALAGVVEVDEIKIFLEKTIKFIELKRDFIEFVKHGDLTKVREALAYKVSVNISDDNAKSALAWACENGNFEMALTLIAAGADMDTISGEGKSALNYAAVGGNVELMKLLIEQGAKR